MNRALSALGLARRAGKLNWGFDTAVEAMRSGACGVVILAADLSDKTKKNVRFEVSCIRFGACVYHGRNFRSHRQKGRCACRV